MRVKITAGGIYGADGEIPIGTELTVASEPKGWAGRYEIVSKDDPAKTPVTNPTKTVKAAETAGAGQAGAKDAADKDKEPEKEPEKDDPVFVAPAGPFEAKERSPGWWAIYDGKGEVVGKSARKADLAGFDELTEAEKLEFATVHAKAAFDAEAKG